jgi:hypothetical protein
MSLQNLFNTVRMSDMQHGNLNTHLIQRLQNLNNVDITHDTTTNTYTTNENDTHLHNHVRTDIYGNHVLGNKYDLDGNENTGLQTFGLQNLANIQECNQKEVYNNWTQDVKAFRDCMYGKGSHPVIGLQNLNINEVNNINHKDVQNSSETYLHGMTVDGNQYDLEDNMNAGLQIIAPNGLQNLLQNLNTMSVDSHTDMKENSNSSQSHSGTQ